MSEPRLAVHCQRDERFPRAQALALTLSLPLIDTVSSGNWDFLLQYTAQGLQLQPCDQRGGGPIAVDFGSGQMRYRRRGGHNEILGRAVGVGKRQHLHVVDATAGLGRDGFVLADSGCRVTLLERHPVVHALLADGLERARCSRDAWLAEVAARLALVEQDGINWLRECEPSPDVVYLDPMFPERKKSALVKKEMRVFQLLVGDDPDAGELLGRARQLARYRVVVKRPARAPELAGQKPGFTLSGKSVRFDVYPA